MTDQYEPTPDEKRIAYIQIFDDISSDDYKRGYADAIDGKCVCRALQHDYDPVPTTDEERLIELGRSSERERIVKWLRRCANIHHQPSDTVYWYIADAIKRGEHREDG